MHFFHWPHWQAVHLVAAVFFAATCGLVVAGRLVNSIHVLVWMLGAMVVAWVAFFISARIFYTRGLGLFTIIVWGIIFRLPGFFTEPLLEDDHYRYLWDGLMLCTGDNPYAQAPIDFFEREDLDEARRWILSNINHPDLATIYGPFAQLLFALAQWFTPGSLLGLRLIIVAADMFVAFLLFQSGGWRAALLWSWCPLLIKEGVFNAHFESVAIALSLSACCCANKRSWIGGVLLSCAVATRPFALLLAPFVFFSSSRCQIVVRAIAFAITLFALHAPFGLGQVGGSLRAFAGEWEFNSSVFALLKILVGPTSARVVCLVCLGAVCAFVYRRWLAATVNAPTCVSRLATGEGLILFAAVFFLSPVANPWYALWMLPFLASLTRPHFWAWTLLVACSLCYITSLNLGGDMGYFHPWWVRPLEFIPVLVAAFLQFAMRRRPSCRCS